MTSGEMLRFGAGETLGQEELVGDVFRLQEDVGEGVLVWRTGGDVEEIGKGFCREKFVTKLLLL